MSSHQRTKTFNGYSSLHPQFNLYETDGKGRDMYISYNNGGFWKDNLYKIKYSPNYTQKYTPRFFSLIHPTPPFTYYSDGTGRDGYVLFDKGLKRQFSPANKFIFGDLLRQSEPQRERISFSEMSKGEILRNKKLSKIQKDVSNRLYQNKNFNLPTVKNEPLIKYYAKTGVNFFNNPKGKYALTSPKFKENHQVHFRTGKKKVRVTLNDIE
ncbi:MAG: hypothetical protein MJ252_23830 [archaeon]|nr:hypothetical protein [archaeon]